MPDTQDLILTELQQLRRDFSKFAFETGQRVSTLEAEVHGLVGNGQPGRVALLEEATRELSQWRWRLVGASAGSSGAISIVVSVVAWILDRARK